MKKKILSQLFIVSFAFAGLFLVGNNVRGIETPPGDQGKVECKCSRWIFTTTCKGRWNGNYCWEQDEYCDLGDFNC